MGKPSILSTTLDSHFKEPPLNVLCSSRSAQRFFVPAIIQVPDVNGFRTIHRAKTNLKASVKLPHRSKAWRRDWLVAQAFVFAHVLGP